MWPVQSDPFSLVSPPACRWEAACAGLQPEWRVEWSALQERPRLGALQLHHTSQQSGEAQLVSRACVSQRCRVPALLPHQRELSGPGKREQPRPAVHISALRGESLPLQDQHLLWWKGTHMKGFVINLQYVLRLHQRTSFLTPLSTSPPPLRCMWRLRAALPPWPSWSTTTPLSPMAWSPHCTTQHPNVTSPRCTVCHPSTTNGRWSAQTSPWSTSWEEASTGRCTWECGKSTTSRWLSKHSRSEAHFYVIGLFPPTLQWIVGL